MTSPPSHRPPPGSMGATMCFIARACSRSSARGAPERGGPWSPAAASVGVESAHPGRVAQWESARFTREKSLVRTQPCPSKVLQMGLFCSVLECRCRDSERASRPRCNSGCATADHGVLCCMGLKPRYCIDGVASRPDSRESPARLSVWLRRRPGLPTRQGAHRNKSAVGTALCPA
jgi:hypothetical protein